MCVKEKEQDYKTNSVQRIKNIVRNKFCGFLSIGN